jgi:hypothetical protein
MSFIFSPLLYSDQVCEDCVKDHFDGNLQCSILLAVLTPVQERLYQIEHPQIVVQFDEVNNIEENSGGYWISKPWLKGLAVEVCLLVF